ncbi:alpha/beta fold hydrolase [Singulisphaera sp. PoT]|uniref:alpha/beta fold hydrolase n=1 Tax=Singulisphaera sp. PoT TaxID=3411797 RepID=UPI003BF5D7B0
MVFSQYLAFVILLQVAPPETALGVQSPSEVRKAFTTMLDRPKVPLDINVAETEPLKGGLVLEKLDFASEEKANGKFERVPVLLIRPEDQKVKHPAVIVLHGTGGNKESLQGWLTDLASRGIIGVAIDARYHGARVNRAKGADAYVAAITKAWRAGSGEAQEHPFYYDTCWDLWRTVDYLESRGDVDSKKIGMFGISMGGIQTWLAASVDERVAVAVPAIAVQSFQWSLENGQWQGRARTIAGAHQAAAKDLGEPEVNAKVCRALWNKVIPGMLGQFDCPNMLRLFADRPLLILNGELDPNCPLGGAERAFAAAEEAYKKAGVSDRLKIDVAKGVGHAVTDEQRKETLDWFVRWLNP